MREGLGNEEIAARLNKSLGTVKNQLRSVFTKLEISSRAQLVRCLH